MSLKKKFSETAIGKALCDFGNENINIGAAEDGSIEQYMAADKARALEYQIEHLVSELESTARLKGMEDLALAIELGGPLYPETFYKIIERVIMSEKKKRKSDIPAISEAACKARNEGRIEGMQAVLRFAEQRWKNHSTITPSDIMELIDVRRTKDQE